MSLKNFSIARDPQSQPFCSTKIIVDEMNDAAKSMGLYSDSESVVVYDALCQRYGLKPDAFWCAFELPFVKLILDNAGGIPILGLSRENAVLGAYGGYPSTLLNYATLGVNRNHWPLVTKKYMLDKFVFLAMDESSTRSSFDILIEAFGKQFQYNQNVCLYIKDRNATETFKTYVREQGIKYGVTILHDDRNITNFEEQVKIFEHADAAINLNHSHSFGMVVLQGMSAGLPTICPRYNGFTDYTSELTNGCLKFDIIPIRQWDIEYLVSIGLKNHLFPITSDYYKTMPFWSQVDIQDVRDKMQRMVDDSNWRNRLSQTSDMVASWFTWERTAVNMGYVLSKF